MKLYTPLFLSITMAAMIGSHSNPASAQETVAPLTPAELESRRQSSANLENHISQRNERLGRIVSDIRSLDDRVEDGVTEIVSMLSQVKDSEESN